MKVELNRSAFEAFAQRNEFGTYRTDRKGDGYDSSHTQLMWMAWCAAIQQADAQQPATDEPVYWEWRHLGNNQFAADFGQWSEWKRVEARSPIFTAEDELRTLRRYIADGYKYELRALYTHPAQGVPDDVARDAERGRFLLEWLKRYGLLQAEFGQMGVGEKPEDWWLLHAPFGIDKTRPFFGHGKTPKQAIDAAMLAAK